MPVPNQPDCDGYVDKLVANSSSLVDQATKKA